MELAILIGIVLGTSLAGCAAFGVLANPGRSAQGMTVIPYGGLAGFLLAGRLAFLIAQRITGRAKGA